MKLKKIDRTFTGSKVVVQEETDGASQV